MNGDPMEIWLAAFYGDITYMNMRFFAMGLGGTRFPLIVLWRFPYVWVMDEDCTCMSCT